MSRSISNQLQSKLLLVSLWILEAINNIILYLFRLSYISYQPQGVALFKYILHMIRGYSIATYCYGGGGEGLVQAVSELLRCTVSNVMYEGCQTSRKMCYGEEMISTK